MEFSKLLFLRIHLKSTLFSSTFESYKMKRITITFFAIAAATFALISIAAEDQFLVQQAHKNQLAHEAEKAKSSKKITQEKTSDASASASEKDKVLPKVAK